MVDVLVRPHEVGLRAIGLAGQTLEVRGMTLAPDLFRLNHLLPSPNRTHRLLRLFRL